MAQTLTPSGAIDRPGRIGRQLAVSLGDYGSVANESSLDATDLGYGVPGGTITDGFYRDARERQATTGRTWGRDRHLGIDVSTSNAHGGGADDARRGLPVYGVVKRTIPLADLNSVRVTENDTSSTGLGIDGQGSAELSHAIVLAQPWGTQSDAAYGGVVGLACRYGYTRNDGSSATLTLYLEYLHLITATYLPKDGDGRTISADTWATTGKGIGFGPKIQNGARLTADDLSNGDPILIGHLGATQFPHTHIQAAYGAGEQRYLRSCRFDPSVMLRASAAVGQSLAAMTVGLRLNNHSFTSDVPGEVPALAPPSAHTDWAAAAAMLLDWRLGSRLPLQAVVDRAGPEFRSAFDAAKSLSPAEVTAFLRRLDLAEEPTQSRTIDEYRALLRRFGPLWIFEPAHGRSEVMTGAQGDGTADATELWLIDPTTGARHHETWGWFAATLERASVAHCR